MPNPFEIEIAGRRIGPGHPPFVICELSGNHNGDLDRALAMIDAAAATGCDAIKIQTYTADTITMDIDRPEFRIEGGLWDGRSLHELYQEAQTPYEWHPALFARARARGVILFSSPFDETAVDLLAELDAPAFKIASFEAIDLPLIAYAARRGKPLIISTGMANLAEIEAARDTALAAGAAGVVLLHCVSSYPASFADANLRTIPDMASRFGCPVGLSDHTPGTAAAVAAVALGACVIEKHFTLARADGGPDAAFSLEPDEFSALVRDSRAAWESLGAAQYELLGSERANAQFRRSLYVAADVKAGTQLSPSDVRSIRPGMGLSPQHRDAVVGRVAARDLRRGEPLAWNMLKDA
ncbi:pseudaminic acid synthase [Phenylobacterium sp.]|uniref:pseudaminic acid synthase n=1 Tax=Phenylobacterium sp. TaxID=1871053 RepID=UPI00272F37C7|nr:pseudaminic acid synthase [Phenylobacterium sp.]MDP1872943.1 pseudaminic acid synthase [Phenylobacterium sp.]MDP3300147.1 pseudaminic acid synthase [Phenylobacterium sp.]